MVRTRRSASAKKTDAAEPLLPSSFTGFGASRLDPAVGPKPWRQVDARRPADRKALRAGVLADCPKTPGVYAMLDPKGAVLYVGKAKRLRYRLLSYFHTAKQDAKARRIVKRTASVVWEQCPDEFGALLRELELIRRIRPPFNVQGLPGRTRRAYLCLGRTPAPYLFLSPEAPAGALAVLGPIRAGERTREAVRKVNDFFRLRDCPQKTPLAYADQGRLFPIVHGAHCLRYELGTCTGPCIAAPTRAEYMRQVKGAKEFLAGRSLAPLESVTAAMKEAVRELRFELAAVHRDVLALFNGLLLQLGRLHAARNEYAFLYPTADAAGGETWYFVRGGRVFAGLPAPTDPGGAARVAAMIDDVFPDEARPGEFVEDPD
ncbi:MAG: GIY-YIG nuclease family protein, partial [Planctomycetia bacterium]